jgi:flagellar biosynthesis protein FlhA
VIQAFGNFVMAGNFIIGIIVFTILVIVIGRPEILCLSP